MSGAGSGSSGGSGERVPCPVAAQTVTCQECAAFLLDYLDGLLPEEQRFKFDSHLAFCRDCAVYLENYRKAAALTAGLGRDARVRAGSEVPAHLVEAVLRARRGGGGAPGGPRAG